MPSPTGLRFGLRATRRGTARVSRLGPLKPWPSRPDGLGAWIRTRECRNQNPVPYHLATPQHRLCPLRPPPTTLFEAAGRRTLSAKRRFGNEPAFCGHYPFCARLACIAARRGFNSASLDPVPCRQCLRRRFPPASRSHRRVTTCSGSSRASTNPPVFGAAECRRVCVRRDRAVGRRSAFAAYRDPGRAMARRAVDRADFRGGGGAGAGAIGGVARPVAPAPRSAPAIGRRAHASRRVLVGGGRKRADR